VDDRPFGGGDGMIMMPEPLAQSVREVRSLGAQGPVIYLSPKGQVFNDQRARLFAGYKDVTLVCGRYGGVDERFINYYVDEQISLGDFVLSGGEMAALSVIDAVSRHIPGVLGNQDSAQAESFANGLLEAPQFTRPRVFEEQEIPAILLEGNHQRIRRWREIGAVVLTLAQRPDLLVDFDWGPMRQEVRVWIDTISDGDWRVFGLGAWTRQEIKERLDNE
jgi:tRNA (guanine37-N1)-methyltransferase